MNAGDSFNRIDDLAVTGIVSVSIYQFPISLGFGAGLSCELIIAFKREAQVRMVRLIQRSAGLSDSRVGSRNERLSNGD